MVAEKNELNLETASLFYGNGLKKKHSTSKNGIQHVPVIDPQNLVSSGAYTHYYDPEVGPDGSIYVLKNGRHLIRISPDRTVSLVAGGGTSTADSIPASQASLTGVFFMDFDSQGNLFYSEGNYYSNSPINRVRKIDKYGIVTTVAGTTNYGYSGDGGPALQALFHNLAGIAISPGGNIYVADYFNHRVRCIGADGFVTTVAGGGTKSFTDGMIATEFKMGYPSGIAMGLDGSVYISAQNGYVQHTNMVNSIFRLGTDGRLYHHGGALRNLPTDRTVIPDGTPAKEAAFCLEWADEMFTDNQGLVNFTSFERNHLYKIDNEGKVRLVIGGGQYTGGNARGKNPLEVNLNVQHATYGRYGELYFINEETGNPVVQQVTPTTLALVDGKYEIPSMDGSEIYVFNEYGKHIQTLNAFTRRMLMTFQYDSGGRLNSILDKDSLKSTFVRDSNGYITAIVSPKGERTELAVDSTGMLASVKNPNQEQIRFRYSDGGLMSFIEAPEGGEQAMVYDSLGRLISASTAETPAGHLTKTLTDDGYTVTSTSPTGITSTIDLQQSPLGTQVLTGTDPYGRQTVANINTSGVDSVTTPDGSVIITERTYDPRYGTQVPIAGKTTVRLPSGLTSVQTQSRAVSLLVGQEVKGITDKTNINGREWTEVWDGNARTNTKTSSENRRSITFFNEKDQVVKDSIPGLVAMYYEYDNEGRLIKMRNGTRIARYIYDSMGRLMCYIDPYSRTDSTFYDDAGRVVRYVLTDGREVNYSYDLNGNMVSLKTPRESFYSFAYDRDNRPLFSTIPINEDSTSIEIKNIYDNEGRLIRTIYPDSTSIEIEHNPIDGKKSEVRHDHKIIKFVADSNTGNLSMVYSTDGDTLSYTYDGSWPLSEKWSGRNNATVSNRYDNSFRLIEQTINSADTIRDDVLSSVEIRS